MSGGDGVDPTLSGPRDDLGEAAGASSGQLDGVDHFLGNELGRPGFSAAVEPVLRITPGTGETIGFETSDAVYAELHGHHDLAQLSVPINPVTGPVFVEGAMPGDALAVTVHDIRLVDHGWSVSLPGSGALQHVMGDEMFTRRVPIDADGVHVTSRHTFAARPMIGCMGTAPAKGENSTIMPAYPQGGNMDVTENTVGSTEAVKPGRPSSLPRKWSMPTRCPEEAREASPRS